MAPVETPPPQTREPTPLIPARSPPSTSLGGANLRAVYIIWYRDIVRYSRDRFRLVASLAQPLLYLVIFGTGLSASLGGGRGGGFGGGLLDYKQFLYGGIIGMSFSFS